MSINYNNNQSGSVSMFAVVFSALLIIIITMSFVGIMMQDQQQAADADLSQSAYDSALAGVEDAKRALLLCEEDSTKCPSELASQPCNDVIKNLTDLSSSVTEEGVKVKTGTSDELNQAYTCVKVETDTFDYLGSLSANEFEIIPLETTNYFDTVAIEWFNVNNLSSQTNLAIDLQNSGNTPLLSRSDWPINRPSVIQAQLIQYDNQNGFRLNDFNNNSAGNSNSSTLFLYPSSVGTNQVSMSSDRRRSSSNTLSPIVCKNSLSSGGYSCSASLVLPNPIGGGSRTAFLRIGSFYNNSDYRVTLKNSKDATSIVKFDNVQPEIDSTGRANDLFRRVKVRVKLTDTAFPYPDAAVYTSGDLCKNFMVTNLPSDYTSTSSCKE